MDIDFGIPPFHRTVATENGGIYIIGGTIVDTFKKSKTIYQYNASNRKLLPVTELLIARSSHSVLCHKEMIYITGGMTDS